MPTFHRNRQGFLKRAIESVLKQTYRNFEFHICDDGSYDGSRETIGRFAKIDSRIVYHRFHENCGLPAWRGASAWHKSQGEFLTWCFDDCEWTSEHLEALLDHFHLTGNRTAVVYGKARLIYPDGTEAMVGRAINLDELRSGTNHIPNSPLMQRRATLAQVGWYDPSVILRRNCDWELWLRMIDAGLKFEFVDICLNTEFGCILPNSLGNTSTVLPQLRNQWMNFPRRCERLMQTSILEFDPLQFSYYRNFYESLAPDHQWQLIFLLVEHYLNIGRLDLVSLLDHAAHVLMSAKTAAHSPLRLRETNFLNRYADEQHSALMLYLSIRDTLTEALREEIVAKQAFIDTQQSYIDGQRRVIDNHCRELAGLQQQLLKQQRPLKILSQPFREFCNNLLIRRSRR